MAKKKDMILIGVLLLIALAAFAAVRVFAAGGTEVVISQYGKVYGQYDLNKDQVIYIEAAEGSNTVTIRDGSVSMSEASCPDQICVYEYPLSGKTGGMIVCLPHELVVEIVGAAS